MMVDAKQRSDPLAFLDPADPGVKAKALSPPGIAGRAQAGRRSGADRR
jgi:hypothetical protein